MDGTTHPETATLQQFAQRRLPPAEALALSRHLATCEPCRAQLAAFLPSRDPAWCPSDDPLAHLSEDEIADAAIDESLLEPSAQEHLTECDPCQTEVAAARTSPVSATVLPMKPPASKLLAWPVWTSIAAAVLISVAIWKSHPIAPSAPTSAVLLHDGGGTLGLDAQGQLVASVSLDEQDRALLASVLSTGHLPSSQSALSANTGLETLRGEAARAAVLTVLSPLNTATSATPTFAWTPLSTAKSYQVELYDAGFHLLQKSPTLTSAQWTPSTPLTPGLAYSWVIRAKTSAGEITAPEPPAPPARFDVADAASLAAIDAARTQHPELHLLLASLYARAGMRAEALQQIDALTAENTSSALAQKLRASIVTPQFAPTSTNPAQ